MDPKGNDEDGGGGKSTKQATVISVKGLLGRKRQLQSTTVEKTKGGKERKDPRDGKRKGKVRLEIETKG